MNKSHPSLMERNNIPIVTKFSLPEHHDNMHLFISGLIILNKGQSHQHTGWKYKLNKSAMTHATRKKNYLLHHKIIAWVESIKWGAAFLSRNTHTNALPELLNASHSSPRVHKGWNGTTHPHKDTHQQTTDTIVEAISRMISRALSPWVKQGISLRSWSGQAVSLWKIHFLNMWRHHLGFLMVPTAEMTVVLCPVTLVVTETTGGLGMEAVTAGCVSHFDLRLGSPA